MPLSSHCEVHVLRRRSEGGRNGCETVCAREIDLRQARRRSRYLRSPESSELSEPSSVFASDASLRE